MHTQLRCSIHGATRDRRIFAGRNRAAFCSQTAASNGQTGFENYKTRDYFDLILIYSLKQTIDSAKSIPSF